MRVFPEKQGLYDPSHEKDSCGVGLVVDVPGHRSHDIVADALEILRNLDHRGARGADPLTGDGCGILTQIPDLFLRDAVRSLGIELPGAGTYGVGMSFLPRQEPLRRRLEALMAEILEEEGFIVLGWRDVPVRDEALGPAALATRPVIRQVFVAARHGARTGDPARFERGLYMARRRIEAQAEKEDGGDWFAIPSFSSRTIVYKGLLLPTQLEDFYPDLKDSGYRSAIAMVHSRFSTNTFPAWRLAHPYRYLCHNGEINTLRGNLNWMRARQANLASPLFGDDIGKLLPVIAERQSDSACLDNMVELLVMGGRSLAHAMMMLVPEPWANQPAIGEDLRAFYEYHAALMEPWDGPALVCFSDGRYVGAILDRNGLRPCRHQMIDGRKFVLSSEAGVLPCDPSRVQEKGRIAPGTILLIDTEEGRLIEDREIKAELARARPYRQWLDENQLSLEGLAPNHGAAEAGGGDEAALRRLQAAFGYSREELKMVLAPMAVAGEEPVSSMGIDTPLAILSERPQLLFNYFKQLFAQVTNPPIDPIREYMVMSLAGYLGPEGNLLEETPEACRRLFLERPIVAAQDLARIEGIPDPRLAVARLPTLFAAAGGTNALERALDELCRSAEQAVLAGAGILILSDRGVDSARAPIPSLLAVSAVQQHLIRTGLRARTGLLVETGEARSVHHFACLLGFGAGAVHPYLALESLEALARDGLLQEEPRTLDSAAAQGRFVEAVNKGLLKIFSKMGISTLQSYCGAQVFEALGLSGELVSRHFTGTVSRVGGAGLTEIADECLRRHRAAFATERAELDAGGEIHYRVQGERHAWSPETIARLQHATRSGDVRTFREYSERANREMEGTAFRGLLDFEYSSASVPIDEVEPAREIVRRFNSGAMSLGAISREAHETLAVAMNRLGAKSNTGEGGEDPARFQSRDDGESANSRIKQIASGRFGVTTSYLVNATELQIKIAQGAKPGEGGQLPGHKVDEQIARLRHSTPGVQLISPPPHHDIYSIEDLAQLIFDLKNVNPDAAISVKLVSEAGVGTVAAGVAKAHADKILISGDSGGTGASPLSSIRHAGLPWELGLAETHQTLLLNGLRGRVRIETDGQLRTGRDVVIAALLGAEEFGFATAPLIVEGCIMMRKCHLNTCPVGIATQDPELRKRFTGKPEHLINYFFFVAEEVRELMARLGFRTVSELVGRVDRLRFRKDRLGAKSAGLDLAAILHRPAVPSGTATCKSEEQDHGIDTVLDRQLLQFCQPALQLQESVSLELPVRNTQRTVGALLSGEIARRHGAAGLPDGTIRIRLSGSAGQSFGAFLVPGVTLTLAGEANDYVGKGLSGGRIVIAPPLKRGFPGESSILVGNTALYGATSGEAYFAGTAGERFAVRNSGARAVIEGVGDHGCEYMTGGLVVVLGPTGRNFAAGMSGGVAYVLDEEHRLRSRCNPGMVELEPLSEAEDEVLLLTLLQAHVEFTASSKGRRVLDSWPELRARFVKVMPRDYKAAIARGREESAPGSGRPGVLQYA